ncbi:hypothetical protein OXYTRIMIC_684 [Oxytricha trifallax]|uniref:Uncharacterized protein n=1 Tax=Oxytricha trifallax TaxID=1172189 RepID=A0A073HXL4_9SPIT|nr:hypothetical protein OXYTRIMIC_684 [Oxytricha trifallax]
MKKNWAQNLNSFEEDLFSSSSNQQKQGNRRKQNKIKQQDQIKYQSEDDDDYIQSSDEQEKKIIHHKIEPKLVSKNEDKLTISKDMLPTLTNIVSSNQKATIVSVPINNSVTQHKSGQSLMSSNNFNEEQNFSNKFTRKQKKKSYQHLLPRFMHKDWDHLKESLPPIIDSTGQQLNQCQQLQQSSNSGINGVGVEMANFSQKILKEIKEMTPHQEKIIKRLQEFQKNSELVVSNIMKGLETKIIQCEVQEQKRSQQFNKSQIDQMISPENSQIFRFYKLNMPKLKQLNDQILNINQLLDQIDRQAFKSATKQEIDLSFEHKFFDLNLPQGMIQVEKVYSFDDKFYFLENLEKTRLEIVALNEQNNQIQASSIFSYTKDFTAASLHQDRVIIDEMVFNLDGVQIDTLERYELITSIAPLKDDLLAVGHETYGKINIFEWDGTAYQIVQKLRMHKCMVHFPTHDIQYNKFVSEINLSYQLNQLVYYVPLPTFSANKFPKYYKMARHGNCKMLVLGHKHLSAEYYLIQRQKAVQIMSLKNMNVIIYSIPYDYNGPLLYNLQFDINSFAVSVALTKQGNFQVLDLLNVGFKNKYNHLVGEAQVLCQIHMESDESNLSNRDEFQCIVKDKQGRIGVLMGSIQ